MYIIVNYQNDTCSSSYVWNFHVAGFGGSHLNTPSRILHYILCLDMRVSKMRDTRFEIENLISRYVEHCQNSRTIRAMAPPVSHTQPTELMSTFNTCISQSL